MGTCHLWSSSKRRCRRAKLCLGERTEVPTSHVYSASHCLTRIVINTELRESTRLQTQNALMTVRRVLGSSSTLGIPEDSTRSAVMTPENSAAYNIPTRIKSESMKGNLSTHKDQQIIKILVPSANNVPIVIPNRDSASRPSRPTQGVSSEVLRRRHRVQVISKNPATCSSHTLRGSGRYTTFHADMERSLCRHIGLA